MRLFLILAVGVFTLMGAVAPACADLMDEVYQLTDRKQYGAAMEKLDKFLEKNPNDAQARFLKGLVLTERGQRDDAIVIFRNLSQDYPDLPEPYNNLAVLYAEKGLYDEARSALKKAIKTHPTYATAHENMGDIYAKMASKSYRKALSLSGTNLAIKTKLDHIKRVFVSNTSTPQVSKDKPHRERSKARPAKTIKKTAKPAKKINDSKLDDLIVVERAVKNWVNVWTALDIDGYLNAYSKKFRTPPKFPNYSAWVQNRKRVLGKATSIRVTYKNLRVKLLDENLARAEFTQHYWSPSYKDKVNKTLTLAREGSEWKIVWERSDG
jgi:tetratricopeptide (TPR) repeat protein